MRLRIDESLRKHLQGQDLKYNMFNKKCSRKDCPLAMARYSRDNKQKLHSLSLTILVFNEMAIRSNIFRFDTASSRVLTAFIPLCEEYKVHVQCNYVSFKGLRAILTNEREVFRWNVGTELV